MEFKKYSEFINESLVILSLKGQMKNEFMRNLELKTDFETARREFYMNGGSLLTHISGEEFELRTLEKITSDEIDETIKSHVNASTNRLKFKRFGKPKTDKIKEKIWILKGSLD